MGYKGKYFYKKHIKANDVEKAGQYFCDNEGNPTGGFRREVDLNYHDFLSWKEAGNTPEVLPYVPPTKDQQKARLYEIYHSYFKNILLAHSIDDLGMNDLIAEASEKGWDSAGGTKVKAIRTWAKSAWSTYYIIKSKIDDETIIESDYDPSQQSTIDTYPDNCTFIEIKALFGD